MQKKIARKQYGVEQIIVQLKEIEILCNQGNTITEASRQTGITEQTYYRWRKEYDRMNSADAKRMKELERRTPADERSLLTPQLVQRQGQTTSDTRDFSGFVALYLAYFPRGADDQTKSMFIYQYALSLI